VQAATAGAAALTRDRYGCGVGYNPFRKRVKRRSDVVVVGVTLAVVALLVFWAVLPR
jgi:hypothetical protein